MIGSVNAVIAWAGCSAENVGSGAKEKKRDILFEVLDFNDLDDNGMIDKRTFWDYVGINSEGYKAEIDPNGAGFITREMAFDYLTDNFQSLAAEKQKMMLDFLIERTGKGEMAQDNGGYCTPLRAFRMLKMLNYPKLQDLARQRFLEKDNDISTVAIQFLSTKDSVEIKERFVKMIQTNEFWESLTDKWKYHIKPSYLDFDFGGEKLADGLNGEAVKSMFIQNGDDLRIVKAVCEKLMGQVVQGKDDWYFGQFENYLVKILIAIHDKGYHQGLIKNVLLDVLRAENGNSYRCGEEIAAFFSGEEGLRDDVKKVFKQFFADQRDKRCIGFHRTVRCECQENNSENHATLGGALMLRVRPKGALPDMDVVLNRDALPCGSTPQFSSLDAQKHYLKAYIEKNMGLFSYKGHKIWEYGDAELFTSTFGAEQADQKKDDDPRIKAEDIRKLTAIRRLIEEDPGLFDEIFPIDPRLSEKIRK